MAIDKSLVNKYFCVAGHGFRLSMPEDEGLWRQLDQYAPFEQPGPCDTVFELEYAAPSADLPVEAPLPEEIPVFTDEPDDGMQRISIWSSGDSWIVRFAPLSTGPFTCVMRASKDWSRAVFAVSRQTPEYTRLFGLNNALMILFAFTTIAGGTLLMHASVVMNSGKGYLFLGKSGTGKSTHSSLWIKAVEGSELLNDDNPVLRRLPDGSVRVYGSPWSGKTPCYRNADVPVGAIVKIRRAPFNRCTRLGNIEAYAEVYSSCSGFRTQEGMSDLIHSAVAGIALATPCYVMDCLPDEDAARVCAGVVG